MTPLLKTTRECWDELCEAWRNARREFDEPSVHDLRVAARRVGVCLLLLEAVLDENRASKVRRRIKRLMRKFGRLRDVQVQISMVERWKRTEVPAGFLDSLRRTEVRERGRASRYLTTERKRKIRRSLRSYERGAGQRLKKIQARVTESRVRSALDAQRAAVRSARDGSKSADPDALHLLRTTARRLRYSLEVATSTTGPAPKIELQRLRRYQSELGNRRDAQILQKKLDDWRKKNPQLRAPKL